MRKLIVTEWMSLDGVVQAPGAADEDTSGEFAHGGWHLRYFEETSQAWVVENLVGADGYLLGRRTYETLASYWPHASEEERILAEPLNTRPKYVVSATLSEPLAWKNSTLLQGDAAAAVRGLKAEGSGDLLVMGSTQLVPTLVEHGLVDEVRLMIDPVVLGGGKRIFRDDGVLRVLELVASEVTSTGAILATYVPAP
jgi:dihydrofolate reductase